MPYKYPLQRLLAGKHDWKFEMECTYSKPLAGKCMQLTSTVYQTIQPYDIGN